MTTKSWPGAVGAAWGIGGVLTLLLFSVLRLAQTSFDALAFEWAWWHWCVLLANVIFMAYAEGYKGFQKSYSPRVVARARFLATHWTPVRVIAAPLFCMGYFHATRRRKIAAWLLTLMVIVLVMVFRSLPQPWRGVLDAGVVVGLAWGSISIAMYAGKWLSGGRLDTLPEVPGHDAAAP